MIYIYMYRERERYNYDCRRSLSTPEERGPRGPHEVAGARRLFAGGGAAESSVYIHMCIYIYIYSYI